MIKKFYKKTLKKKLKLSANKKYVQAVTSIAIVQTFPLANFIIKQYDVWHINKHSN